MFGYLPHCSAAHAAFPDMPSNCSDIPFPVVEDRFTVHVPRVHGPMNGLAATAVESRTCERFLVSTYAASWIAGITIRFDICVSLYMPGSYLLFLATTANVNNCSYHSYAIALWFVMKRGLMQVKKMISFTIGTNRCPISLVRSDERQAADIGQWFHQASSGRM